MDALETLDIPLAGGGDVLAAMDRLAALAPEDTLTPAVAEDVLLLWKDAGMQVRHCEH